LLITETLTTEVLNLQSLIFQTQLLKVVLSYYPVCRCQRTSSAHFGQKKLNFAADLRTTPLCGGIIVAGTKLSQFAVPKCTRTTPNYFRARAWRDGHISQPIGLVNRPKSLFLDFFDSDESGRARPA